MKVYVVTSGVYSDFRVDAIFSTMQKASSFVERGFGEDISEYDVDEYKIPNNRNIYHIVMKKDGTVISTSTDNYTSTIEDLLKYKNRPFFIIQTARYGAYGLKHSQHVEILVATLWAKDQVHAVKIVNDLRQQLIALDKWYLMDSYVAVGEKK